MSYDFKTCSVTGLPASHPYVVEPPVERLIRLNMVTSFAFLLAGGVAGLLILLTRWQTVHLLTDGWFYTALSFHGMAMLVAWIVFMEMAILYITSSIILNCRLAAQWVAWLQYGLMSAGMALITVMILMGEADVMFTSYVPLRAHHLYYLGVVLFLLGAILGCVVFFATIIAAKTEGVYTGSLPLVTYGAAAAAIIAILTLAHGVMVFVPTWLWAAGVIPQMDAEVYRLLFWGFGHSTQQINVCAMVAVWYVLGTLTVGAMPLTEKVCRSAFAMYVLFICIASEHHLLVDPGYSAAHKTWNTGYFMHLAVLASMIHAYSVPAAVEVALRKQGHTRGLTEWLKKAPWKNPGFSSLVISIVGFGFLGGITGVIYGTEQINIIAHNTLRIPGHFHGTVVAGTTLAFMGLTYYLLPLVLRREVVFSRVALYQPYVFGFGMYVCATAMMFVGSFGVSRRSWDMNNIDGAFSVDFGPMVDLGLAVMGIGGVIGVIGGFMFLLVVFGTLLYGKELKAVSYS